MVVFRKPNYTEPVFFMGVSIAFGDLSSFSFHPIWLSCLWRPYKYPPLSSSTRIVRCILWVSYRTSVRISQSRGGVKADVATFCLLSEHDCTCTYYHIYIFVYVHISTCIGLTCLNVSGQSFNHDDQCDQIGRFLKVPSGMPKIDTVPIQHTWLH